MKTILLSLLTIFTCSSIFSQVILEENFDSYTVDDKIAVVSGTDWTTWSKSPGGSEDAKISSAFAASPSNALHVVKDVDCVMKLGNKGAGRYSIKFNVLIEAGKIGYFNVLNKFAGSNSEWGVQIYFNKDGEGSFDAGKANAGQFSYEYDTWMPVIVFVDIDSDHASILINNEYNASWKWSAGSFGGGAANKLGAVNFYGTSTGGTSSMFIDDIVYTQLGDAPSTVTLTGNIENDNKDAALSWSEASDSPIYAIYRNGQFIKQTSDLSFSDENIYPGESMYSVRVVSTELGDSENSNVVALTRPGGSDRSLVLFEVGTGTGCPNCPSAARGVDDMVEKGDQVAILEYHNYNGSDPYNCAASTTRASNYYGITGYPTQFNDGKEGQRGGGYNGTLYTTFHNFYNNDIERLSLYSINTEIEAVNNLEYIAHITIDENSEYYQHKAKQLRVALTETDIPFSWQGLSHVDYAVRDMYPSAIGTVLDLSSGSQTIDISFSLDASWVKDNCELVVFLQTDDNKEVLETIKIDMADVASGTKNLNNLNVNIYPNPVKGMIFTNMNKSFDYTINSITGQKMMNGNSSNGNINIQNLDAGIYILNISTLKGNTNKKFIKM